MDLTVNCGGCNVTPNNGRMVVAEITDVDKQEILDHFSPEDITSYYDHDDLLKHIDISTVKKYFDLIEPE